MAPPKKKFVDPGLTDPNPPFTPAPPGTGFMSFDQPVTTIKDTTVNPQNLPGVEGTFLDKETGRPRGVTRGGQTRFGLFGSDLELFQQQQDKKEGFGVSGAAGFNPRKTLAENIAIQQALQKQSQAAETTGQAQKIPSIQSLAVINVHGRIQTQATTVASQMLDRISKGEATAEEIAFLGLTPFDIQILQSGQADISRFSQIIESIPVLGKRKFGITGFKFSINDFIGSGPSQRVEELINGMKLDIATASGYADNIALGISPDFHREQIKKIEQDILEAESLIKLLSIQSEIVQSDPRNIDTIMGEIQNHKNSLTSIKARAIIQ